MSDLPESLHSLVRRNGVRVGYDPDFHLHMERLIKGLEDLLRAKSEVSEAASESFSPTLSKFEFTTIRLDRRC